MRYAGKFIDDEIFEKHMEEYWNVKGSETELTLPDTSMPEYKSMSQAELDSYLYWRTRLEEGEVINGNTGFIYLRLSEMANMPMDPEEVRKECILLIDSDKVWDPCEVGRFYFDYQISHGMQPDVPLVVGPMRSSYNASISSLFTDPSCHFGPGSMKMLLRCSDLFDYCGRAREILPYFRTALAVVCNALAENGKTALGEYGEGKRIKEHTIGDRVKFLHGERRYILEYTDVDMDGRFGEFLGGVLRMAVNQFCKDNGMKGPTIPAMIPKQTRKMFTDAVKNNFAPIDMPSVEPDLGFWRITDYDEEALLVRGVPLSNYSPGAELGNDIVRFRDMENDEDLPYIPSGYDRPEYSKLKNGKLEYYFSWRTKVRKGIYTKTDMGYIWLLMTELLNDVDPERSMGIMTAIRNAYDPTGSIESIGRSMAFHATVHDLDIPRSDLFECSHTAGRVVAQVSSGREGEITRSTFDALAKVIKDKIVPGFDNDCAMIMNMFLRTFNKALDDEDRHYNTIEKYYLRKDTLNITNFCDLRFYGYPTNKRSIPAPCYDGYDRWFCSDLKNVMKSSVECLRAAREGKRVEIGNGLFAGIGYMNVLNDAVDRFLSEERAVKVTAIRRKVEIDRDAVDTAKADLEKVTELMRIDDGTEDKETVSEEPETADGPSGSWQSFRSSLTVTESSYIAGIVNGTSCPDMRLEDSINSKAMDHIGDTVIEDGSIIEDYLQELGVLLDSGTDGKAAVEEFVSSLTDDELTYLKLLSEGRRIPGRRPTRRIESINSKSESTLGVTLIENGTLKEGWKDIL